MIKLATGNDIERLVSFTADGFAKYDKYARHGIDRERIFHTAMGMITSPSAFILIDEVENEIAGSIGGMVMNFGYSRAKFATDVAFYVKPEYAKEGIGLKLFQEFIVQCKELGANEIRTGATIGENAPIIESFCKTSGFEYRGVLYDLNLESDK